MEERPRWRTTLTGRVTPRLQLGLEYNALAPEATVNPIGNYFIQTETENRPGIVAGFSSDRIGTPLGMAYFVTAQKLLGGERGWFAPYVGLSYSEWGRELLVPFGASIALCDNLMLVPMFDGKHGHTTLSWMDGRGRTLSLIAVFNQRLGVAFAQNF
ncbi:MAG: hypothetical protein OHK0029_35280 [Armatimonadaceae bacterium]